MDDWDEHRLILAISRAGTLRGAAETLKVTHTTVARRLSTLETSQALPLFVRSGRSYKITRYGTQRVAIAEKIEALDFEAERLQRSSVDSLSGPLSLSVPRAFLQHGGVLSDIDDFVSAYPNIDLTVAASDALADLDKGQADVVIRGQIGPDPHLVGRLVSPIGLQFYANRRYLETNPPETYQWISAPSRTLDGSKSTSTWLSESPYPDAPVRLVIDDIVSRHNAVSEGLGLGRLACFMADPNPNLVLLEHGPAVRRYDLWILTHPDLKDAPKIKALMQWLWQSLRQRKALFAGAE